jgi:hypothetical protein
MSRRSVVGSVAAFVACSTRVTRRCSPTPALLGPRAAARALRECSAGCPAGARAHGHGPARGAGAHQPRSRSQGIASSFSLQAFTTPAGLPHTTRARDRLTPPVILPQSSCLARSPTHCSMRYAASPMTHARLLRAAPLVRSTWSFLATTGRSTCLTPTECSTTTCWDHSRCAGPFKGAKGLAGATAHSRDVAQAPSQRSRAQHLV